MHHVGGLFHAVQSAADEFVGADDLQAGAIHRIVDGRIHALHLRAQQGCRLLQVVGDHLELGAHLGS